MSQFENRVTVCLWKYRGSNSFKPENLGLASFPSSLRGAPGAEAGTMFVYLSRYDPSGNYWMHNSQRSFDYDVEWLTFGMHKPGIAWSVHGLHSESGVELLP